MILRRVIGHFKKQEWTAIFLDFVIVVAGILIAFRITEWSDARKEAKEEHLALERLQSESEDAVRFFRSFVERHAEDNSKGVEAIAALTAGSLESFDRDRVEEGLFTLGRYPAVAPKNSTYDELQASGVITRISNRSVREAVAAYHAELEFIGSQLTFFRQRADRDAEAAGVSLGYVYEPHDGELLKRKMDFEALAANEAYVMAATHNLRNQIVFQRYRIAVLEEAEQMCRELSRAIGQDCAPLAEAPADGADATAGSAR